MTTPLNGTVIVTSPGAPVTGSNPGGGAITVTPALQGPPGPQGPPGSGGTTTVDGLTDATTVGKAVVKAASAAAARTAIGAIDKATSDLSYVPRSSPVGSYAYDSNGNVTQTPDGTTYSWESDGAGGYRVHTETVGSTVRTFTYAGDGSLGSVA